MAAGGSSFLACTTCHSRKQRCDMPPGGGQCSNCRALNVECLPRTRKPRARKRESSTFSATPDDVNSPSARKRTRDSSVITEDHELRERSSHTPMPESDKGVYVNFEGYGSHELRVRAPQFEVSSAATEASSSLGGAQQAYLNAVGCFDLPNRSIRDGVLASFFDRVLPWCPVFTSQDIAALKRFETPHILNNAVLLAGAMVSTASGRQELADKLLSRVKALLHCGPDVSPVVSIKVFLILAWSNNNSTALISMDGHNLWQSQLVALAYQCGLHREPPLWHPKRKLRRRMWHCVLARDCVSSTTTSRPRAIHDEDTDVRPLTVDDFDVYDGNEQYFMRHIELCQMLGDIAQHKMRGTMGFATNVSFQVKLHQWFSNLPPELHIYDSTAQSMCAYNRKNMQIHLLYLTCILTLFLSHNKRMAPSPSAFLSAGLIAGIFEEMMARGDAQLIPGFFIFTILGASHSLIVARERPTLWSFTEPVLVTLQQALQELTSRYSAATYCQAWVSALLEKAASIPQKPDIQDLELPTEHRPLFASYGPELCRLWHLTAPRNKTQAAHYPTPSESVTNERVRQEEMVGIPPPDPNSMAGLGVGVSPNDLAIFGDPNQLWNFERQQAEGFMGNWLFDDWTGSFGELSA